MLASIHTMGRWDTSDSDILPQAAAVFLRRTVVVENADCPAMPAQRYDPSGPLRTGEPVRLRLGGNHWTVADRDQPIPGKGDCLYHSLLLGVGHPQWQNPAVVQDLRSDIARTVERNFRRFNAFLVD